MVAVGYEGLRDRDGIRNTADPDQLVYALRLRAWLQSLDRGQQNGDASGLRSATCRGPNMLRRICFLMTATEQPGVAVHS
jgi:hypothetical protein